MFFCGIVRVAAVMVVMVMVVMKLVDSFVLPNSDHCLALSVTESVSPLVEFCLNWICQSCYMHIFKLSDGFVKNVIWISLSFSWICLN